MSTDRTYAVGPHAYDPRTGEILDADIMFAHSWVHYWTRERAHYADARGKPAVGAHADGAVDVEAALARAQDRAFELLGEGSASGEAHAAHAHVRPGPCGMATHSHRMADMGLMEALAASEAARAGGAGGGFGGEEAEWGDVPMAFMEEASPTALPHSPSPTALPRS